MERPNVASNLGTTNAMARITGGFYLAFFVASVLAMVLGSIGPGSPTQVYEALATDLNLFRLGLVVALVSGLLFVVAAWGLYVILRPVNRDLALLFLVLNAIGVAVQAASLLSLVSAMVPGDAADHLGTYSSGQLEGLAFLAINTYRLGWVTAQLFFGAWLFPLGYLVYKSGFLPRALGVLLILDGFAVAIWFTQALLLPDYPAIRYPGLVVSFVAEIGLAVWLVVKGVRVPDSDGRVPSDKAYPGLPAHGTR